MKGEIPMQNIIRFTNGDDGVFAHVVGPDGRHLGLNIGHLAEGDSLSSRFFQAVADRVRDEAEAAALTMPDADKDCCGQHHAKQDAPTDDNYPCREQYEEIARLVQRLNDFEAAINELATRLRQADAVIISLVQKAGGEVTLTQDDLEGVVGHAIDGVVAEDRSTFTFRTVPVPPAAETAQ